MGGLSVSRGPTISTLKTGVAVLTFEYAIHRRQINKKWDNVDAAI